MPHKVCLEPGCPVPAAPKGRGRCAKHSAQREQSINRKGRKVYNLRRWTYTRRKKLALNPLCERCGAMADTVHHKQGVENDAWSPEHLESLCSSCHSKLHRRANA